MEAEAIVLATTEHGESDLIVSFFSRHSGKLVAIAKGAKKSKKRFVNKLEIFSFLHLNYSQKSGRSLVFLEEAELHNSFLNLRKQPELYNVASIIREFLLLGIREAEPDEKIFFLSLWALYNLAEQKQQPHSILILFLVRFFDHLGYRPDFAECGQCNSQYTSRTNYLFNALTGNLICANCSGGRNGRQLSHGTIKILKSAQNQSLDKLHRLRISGFMAKESLHLLHNFGRQIFQRDIISWKVLNSGRSRHS